MRFIALSIIAQEFAISTRLAIIAHDAC
jgi:hypothetical protein